MEAHQRCRGLVARGAQTVIETIGVGVAGPNFPKDDDATEIEVMARDTGSTLRAQSVEAKGQIADELSREVLPLLETGQVKPVTHANYPLSQAVDAHRAIDEAHVGKIILTMEGHGLTCWSCASRPALSAC